MTTVSLEHLFGMVTAVRDDIIANYATDQNGRMNVMVGNGEDWILPLMSCAPGGPALETPCGAIRYTQHNPDDTYPTSQGAGKATFALLTRVPTERDLIGLAPLGITLASISAGKHSHHESHSSIVRYTQITPSLILKYESTNFIPHLQLMPLCVDILSRFAKQMEALPHDLEWRENVSCFQHAA